MELLMFIAANIGIVCIVACTYGRHNAPNRKRVAGNRKKRYPFN